MLYLIIVIELYQISAAFNCRDMGLAGGPREVETGDALRGSASLEHDDHAVPAAGRHHQWRDLCAARACAGAGVCRHPRHPDSAGRVRHLWRAELRRAGDRQGAGHRVARDGDGRGRLRARPVRRAAIAAAQADRALALRSTSSCPRHPGPDLWARRPADADRGQYRAVAADRRGDRTVPLPHRVPAARAHLGAGAADRLRRLPSRAAGPRPRVLRRRRPARPGAVERGAHGRPAALHRPEPCGLRADDRLHRRAVAVLRLHADGQGAARHRRQPARRAPRRHPHHAVGTDRVPAGFR